MPRKISLLENFTFFLKNISLPAQDLMNIFNQFISNLMLDLVNLFGNIRDFLPRCDRDLNQNVGNNQDDHNIHQFPQAPLAEHINAPFLSIALKFWSIYTVRHEIIRNGGINDLLRLFSQLIASLDFFGVLLTKFNFLYLTRDDSILNQFQALNNDDMMANEDNNNHHSDIHHNCQIVPPPSLVVFLHRKGFLGIVITLLTILLDIPSKNPTLNDQNTHPSPSPSANHPLLIIRRPFMSSLSNPRIGFFERHDYDVIIALKFVLSCFNHHYVAASQFKQFHNKHNNDWITFNQEDISLQICNDNINVEWVRNIFLNLDLFDLLLKILDLYPINTEIAVLVSTIFLHLGYQPI
jgi:hypothetical protein